MSKGFSLNRCRGFTVYVASQQPTSGAKTAQKAQIFSYFPFVKREQFSRNVDDVELKPRLTLAVVMKREDMLTIVSEGQHKIYCMAWPVEKKDPCKKSAPPV